MEPNTHPKIDQRLCGKPVELAPGKATVELLTLPEMAADERGLVHGGFVFGLADYAAMLAVNQPTVVLAGAETKFLAPVVAGEVVTAHAAVDQDDGKRQTVSVRVLRGEQSVFEGTFRCAVPKGHVLDKR